MFNQDLIDELDRFEDQLTKFNKKLVPYGDSEILNSCHTEDFSKFIKNLTNFIASNLKDPSYFLKKMRVFARNLDSGFRTPTWNDLHKLSGVINICKYQIRSEDSREIKELLINENNVEHKLAKARVLKDILMKFHNTATQITKRHSGRDTLKIEDEYDVQDLLYSILKSIFIDVEKERNTDTYAGKSSRLDIAINDISTIIEVKMTRESLSLGTLSGQISEDKDRYINGTKYKTVIFFIYDPGHYIENHASIKQHTGIKYGVHINVIISPGQ